MPSSFRGWLGCALAFARLALAWRALAPLATVPLALAPLATLPLATVPLAFVPLALATLAFVPPAHAQPKPAEETIGAWLLACPAPPPAGAKADPCIMRHRDWVVQPSSGNPSAALEIQARGGAYIPAVALRGMPTQAALGGSLVVKPLVGFTYDSGPRIAMSCGLIGAAYACAPEASVVPAASAGLAKARSITVTVAMSIPGLIDLPPQQRTLELTGINQALLRLAKVEVTDEALPAVPGLDLQAFMDKVLRAAGFENGMADILNKVMPLVGAGRG